MSNNQKPLKNINILPPEQNSRKKKGKLPTKKQAEDALQFISLAQLDVDKLKSEKEAADKALLEKLRRAEQAAEIAKKKEAEKLEEINQKIRRKLRENEAKKLELDRNKKLKNYQESTVGKIKWQSFNFGKILHGFLDSKLMFQIEHRSITYNLYIKDKKLLKKNNNKSYQGCSTELQKLKIKSEKFI